jgi:glycosyltransferase involved in cell wall biosynthesis
MINVLFIHQSAELYGSDKTLLILLKHINRDLFNPVVIIPEKGPLKTEIEKLNVEVHILPVLKLYRNIFTPKNIFKFFSEYKKAISYLDKLHKKNNFDIIYSNTLAVLVGMIFAKKRNIKHLWHVHEIIVHPKIVASIFPKLLFKYADIIVCNSKSTLENLVTRKPLIKKKAVVIYNGIEQINNHDSEVIKEDYGFISSDIIISLIGRINRLKGHKLLLKAYINNFMHCDNIKLLFVGSPVTGQEFYAAEIKKIIDENDLSEKVKIFPFTKNLSPFWKITDVLVMPSTEAESFGLVAAEAMLESKPVIGSNHGGLTEIIIHNETGFLIEPNNEYQLTEALQKLVINEELRAKFGENGKNRVINLFSIEQYISNFEKLFHSIIENKN